MPSRRKQTHAECVAEGRCPCCHLMLGPEEEFKVCAHCRLLHKKRLIAKMARGLCRWCSQRATRRSLCSKHLKAAEASSRERSRQLRAKKLCNYCQGPSTKSVCEPCGVKKSEATKLRREALKKTGRCVNCAEPAIPDRTICPGCREKSAAREQQRRHDPARRAAQRSRAAAKKLAYAEAGLCNGCGKQPPVKDRKRCGRCAEECRIRGRIKSLHRCAAQGKRHPAPTEV